MNDTYNYDSNKTKTTKTTHNCKAISKNTDLAKNVLNALKNEATVRWSSLQKIKYDHITPIYKSLHWLPIKFCISN